MTADLAAPTDPAPAGAVPPAIHHDRTVVAWLFGATASWTGDCVLDVALGWTAVHLVAPATAGLVIAAAMLPQGLLMLYGGVLADRLDTRRIMIVGEAARTIVLVGAAVAWAGGARSAGLLVAVGLCFGTVAGLSNPARATLLRQLVRDTDLGPAVGTFQVSQRLATLAGAPLGAVVVTSFGLPTAMIADAATFAGVLALLLTIVRPRYPLERAPAERIRHALAGTAGYLRGEPRVAALLVGLLAPNLFVGPATDLGLPLRVSGSHWAAAWLGAAEATVAVGAIAGSLIAMRLQAGRTVHRAFVALIVQGVGIVLLGLPSQPAVVTGALVIGVTAGLASVWAGGAFVRMVDPAHLGRVSSVSQLGDLLLLPLVTPFFGVLAGATSLTSTMAAFGVGMMAVNALIARRPTVRTA